MKAGRELDALIAERVMGIKFKTMLARHVDGQSGASIKVRFLSKDTRYELASGGEHYADYLNNVDNYSTDIALAWTVLEKINDENIRLGTFEGKWVCSNVCSDMWGCYFDEPNRYEQMNNHNFFEWADTAPHAICLAALKSVEKK